MIGWRSIAAAHNLRSMIATVLPRVAAGNSIAVAIPRKNVSAGQAAALVANLNSLLFDYFTRQKLGGTNLNFFIVRQLPVIPPQAYDADALRFIVPRVLELTYTACDLGGWAKDLGFTGAPFGWNPERRSVIRAELDSWYAHAYGLTRDELRYVLDPADVMGPDWPSETFRVLKTNEERQFGEYRTGRLVLEAWDRLFGR